MRKSKALILAREEFGPLAHAIRIGDVCAIGIYDILGFRELGRGATFEEALEAARKK